MITLIDYLVLAAAVFCIGLAGTIINRKHVIMMLMCIELMLLAVNTNFIAFAQYLHLVAGEVFVFFVLTVAAVESAVGLAILVLLFRRKGSVDISDINTLKG